MSTSCATKVCSYMSYKCKALTQSSNLNFCGTLNDPKMAPLLEDKSAANENLISEGDVKHSTSTETNSSENSEIQPEDENCVSKLGNLAPSSSPPNANNSVFHRGNRRPFQTFPAGFFNSCGNDLHGKASSASNGMNGQTGSSETDNKQLEFDGFYRCQKCGFMAQDDDTLHEHALLKHDPYECGACGFLVDTQSRLHIHLREDHSDIPVSSWDDFILFHGSVESLPKKKSPEKSFLEKIKKPRKTPCKKCNTFVGSCKLEYYQHLEAKHSDSGLLKCNMCPFIALYKHHLQYHFRNHYGSKPFQCDRCDYSCVNKSMLNSHYKSHSDIYQYSCDNCSYMTKYLHSLKMHLRKYSHIPGRVLNPDGSINNNTIIDVHGKRRGPKSKKRKAEDIQMQEGTESLKSKSTPSPHSTSFNRLPSKSIPIYLAPHIYNNYAGSMYVRSGPIEASNCHLQSPPPFNFGNYPINCIYCEFVAESFEIHQHHMRHHFVGLNQDQRRNGVVNANFPYFAPLQGLDPLNGFATQFNPESFATNIMNQSSEAERRSKTDSRNTDAMKTYIYFQNSTNVLDMNEKPKSSPTSKKEPFFDRLHRERFAFNSQQSSKQQYWNQQNNKKIFTRTPSPQAFLTVKADISEPMNETEILFPNNPLDPIPLDLSLKSLRSEPKNNETSTVCSKSEGATSVTTGDTSLGNKESKTTAQKTNRRKGKAFKLNQYTLECDLNSDGYEKELENPTIVYENSHSNDTQAKGVFGSEIKKSVPRINFKPTLSTPKWNGNHSYGSAQEDVSFQSMAPEQRLSPVLTSTPNYSKSNHAALPAKEREDWGTESNSICSYCCMDTGHESVLQFHSSFHRDGDPFTCAKCGLKCEEKIKFNRHIHTGSRINGMCINSINESEL